MIYRPRFFKPQELVDPDTFADLGDRSLMVFRPEALRMLDELREFLSVPCVVNNWSAGGAYKYSGYRPHGCTVGAKYSAHRMGAGFDVRPRGMTVTEAFERIMANPMEPRVQRIRRIEDIEKTPTWLHVDVYEHPGSWIQIVNP